MDSCSSPLLQANQTASQSPQGAAYNTARAVWPVDLPGAARALGLTVDELVEGFEHSAEAHRINGVVAKRGENGE